MGLMERMERMFSTGSGTGRPSPLLPRTFSQPRTGHTFAQAALFHERRLQPPKMLVQQVVRLVNQADDGVGRFFGRAVLDMGCIGRIR